MGASGPLSINPVALPNLPYDPIADFTPVAQVHAVPLLVLSRSKADIGSVQQLVERAKREPGKVSVASAGVGSMNHLAIELFQAMTGAQLVHVPYKGSGPGLSDLLGGQVTTMFDQMNSSMGFIKQGQLTPLAVTSLKRSPLLPDVPTLDELGLKGYQAATFVGVLAPAGTPQPIVAKLNAAVRKTVETPAVQQKLRELGATPSVGSPEDMGRLVAGELEKWRKVVKQAGVKFE
jgi:tripartite-type tricarboxylate transporter receptor subunit TctC